jgi:hypothetical protein
LADLFGYQVAFAQRSLSLGRRQTLVAYAQTLGPSAVLGFGWINAGVDEVMTRDLQGRPAGKVDNSQNAFRGALAWRLLGDQIGVGFAATVFRADLASADASAVGLDVGVYGEVVPGLIMAAAVRNLAASYSWSVPTVGGRERTSDDDFPIAVHAGASYEPLLLPLPLLISVEYGRATGSGEVSLGGELVVMRTLTLRGGLEGIALNADEGEPQSTFGLMIGGGVARWRVGVELTLRGGLEGIALNADEGEPQSTFGLMIGGGVARWRVGVEYANVGDELGARRGHLVALRLRF